MLDVPAFWQDHANECNGPQNDKQELDGASDHIDGESRSRVDEEGADFERVRYGEEGGDHSRSD